MLPTARQREGGVKIDSAPFETKPDLHELQIHEVRLAPLYDQRTFFFLFSSLSLFFSFSYTEVEPYLASSYTPTLLTVASDGFSAGTRTGSDLQPFRALPLLQPHPKDAHLFLATGPPRFFSMGLPRTQRAAACRTRATGLPSMNEARARWHLYRSDSLGNRFPLD